MKNVQEILDIKEAKENKAYNLPYDTLLQLIEHLKVVIGFWPHYIISMRLLCHLNRVKAS